MAVGKTVRNIFFEKFNNFAESIAPSEQLMDRNWRFEHGKFKGIIISIQWLKNFDISNQEIIM